mmetsp:Transcript_34422/g.82971  ORF Transcript_34422/g.82971 Transcript_34422/m.82971 type:complete len:532 (-) Transcript_34422:43-1638(-)
MSSSSSSGSGSGGPDPWAWLGLLKWTLNQQREDGGDGGVGDGGDSDGETADHHHQQPDFSDAREPPVPMSEEDKEFLEKVLKDGIINEGDRMTEILQEFAKAMEQYRSKSNSNSGSGSGSESRPLGSKTLGVIGEEEEEESHPTSTSDGGGGFGGDDLDTDGNDDNNNTINNSVVVVDDGDIEDLLLELRDICEQIDYARAFVHINGLDYLLGAIQLPSPTVIPYSIRNTCLMVISTLAQNNPPVQKQLVELGAIKIFSDLFIFEIELDVRQQRSSSSNLPKSGTDTVDTSEAPASSTERRRRSSTAKYLTKLIQTISATVRDYDLTEQVFEKLPQSPTILFLGLTWPQQPQPKTNDGKTAAVQEEHDQQQAVGEPLHTKTLFLLRALLTSDSATTERSIVFRDAIRAVLSGSSSPSTRTAKSSYNDYLNHPSSSSMVRETSVNLLRQLLERDFVNQIVVEYKQQLVSLGVQRITALREQKKKALEDAAEGGGGGGGDGGGNERDDAMYHIEEGEEELNDWETILVLLARL